MKHKNQHLLHNLQTLYIQLLSVQVTRSQFHLCYLNQIIQFNFQRTDSRSILHLKQVNIISSLMLAKTQQSKTMFTVILLLPQRTHFGVLPFFFFFHCVPSSHFGIFYLVFECNIHSTLQVALFPCKLSPKQW